MALERHGWKMVRFTAMRGGPVYVDLAEVAAVMDTPDPRGAKDTGKWAQEGGALDVLRGATIYLRGGQGFYVQETADVVFGEVHRYRTEPEPKEPAKKMEGAAP